MQRENPFLVNFKRGFLPAQDPLQRLPEADHPEFNFNIWLNLLAEDLPSLLKPKSLRIIVDILNKKFESSPVPLININRFDPAEVNHAFLVLTMLIQAYVYEDPANPAKVIPRILAENLFALLNYNRRVPVLTYSDYVLHNWCLTDKNAEITPENVEALLTFTRDPQEAWFIKIHVAVEAAFAKAIEAAYKIHSLAQMQSAVANREELFAKYFEEMAKSIEQATAVLGRMYEQCSPAFFFNVLRPRLEGTDKAGGIIFDLSFDKDAQYPVMYRGSSGAQSSTLPALDAILGIKLPNDKMNRVLQGFMDYMPNLHRAFILALKSSNVPDSNERRRAIAQLWLFRKKHLEMPAEYISKEAVKKGIPAEQVTGTGSTNIGLFLSKRARKTGDAAIEHGGPVAKL